MTPGTVSGIGSLSGLGSFTSQPTKSVVTGGTLSSDSTYYYRTFISTNNLAVSGVPLTADILVIAGGGSNSSFGASGQANRGMGGTGAGGLLYSAATSLLTGTYTCTVGAAGGTSFGDNGNNSVFTGGAITQTALGGGGRLGLGGRTGGGSGAGGSSQNSFGANGTAGTAGQGNSGGAGAAAEGGGGGGGAGGAGGNGFGSGGIGAGGVGSDSFSSWLSAISSSMPAQWQTATSTGRIASGGSGGRASNAQTTPGGGGAGSTTATGGSGVANTGGGAGGGWLSSSSGTINAVSGGSGIIIVRYLKSQVE